MKKMLAAAAAAMTMGWGSAQAATVRYNEAVSGDFYMAVPLSEYEAMAFGLRIVDPDAWSYLSIFKQEMWSYAHLHDDDDLHYEWVGPVMTSLFGDPIQPSYAMTFVPYDNSCDYRTVAHCNYYNEPHVVISGRVRPGEVGRVTFYVTSVPEPATWAMMIIGFGVVGAVVRRRRPSAGMSAVQTIMKA